MIEVGESVQVPPTLALYITGLGRILREHFGFVITTHEHWEFTLVNTSTECGNPGKCSWHGVSEAYHAELVERHGTGPWPDYDRHYTGTCDETRYREYLASGQVGVHGRTVELRAQIGEIYTDHAGYMFDVTLWRRADTGLVNGAAFGLWIDGRPFVRPAEVPAEPPHAIAFIPHTAARVSRN